MEGKKYEPCWTYVSNGHHYDLEKNPLIVKIYTRKRTHLTNAGLKTERYLVLKNIAFSDLESIYWTSQWKHVFFPDFYGSTLRGTDDGHREKEKFLVKLRRRLAAIFNDLEIEKFDLVALRHGFGALEVACPMKKRLPALDMSGNAPQVAMASVTKDGRNPAKAQAVGCHNQIQKRCPD